MHMEKMASYRLVHSAKLNFESERFLKTLRIDAYLCAVSGDIWLQPLICEELNGGLQKQSSDLSFLSVSTLWAIISQAD